MEKKPKITATCNVPYCEHHKPINNCIFYRFPVDEAICKKWVQVLGVEDFVHIPAFKLNQLRKVCSCHFTKGDLKPNFTKRLNQSSVPSKFDPRITPLSDQLLAEFPLTKPDVIPTTDTTVGVIDENKIIDNGTILPCSTLNGNPNVPDTRKLPSKRRYRPSAATKKYTYKRLLEEAGVPGAVRTPDLDAVLALLLHSYSIRKELMDDLQKKTNLCDKLLSRLKAYPPPIQSPIGMYSNSDFMTELHNRNVKKKPKGERYSKKEMLFAVGVFKRSKSCYLFLQSFIKLPHEATIRRYCRAMKSKQVNKSL